MHLDWINIALIGIAAIALLSLFGRKGEKAEKHVDASIHEETRKKASAVIPNVAEGADESLFELRHTPMIIQPAEALKSRNLAPSDPAVKDALWVHQRAMIVRLEGELEMAQQAELSDHFAIAAPANQPDDLITQACNDAEKTRKTFADAFEATDIDQYWLGRMLVLLLSNRRLFDHVAWLTDTGTERSRTGSYFLDTDGVITVPIYTTRIADSRRTVLRQLVRTFLHCHGVRGATFPRWVEEGVVRWVEVQRLGAPEKILPRPKQGEPPPKLPDPQRILDPAAWNATDDDPLLREYLPEYAYNVVAWMMRQHKPALVAFLKQYQSGDDESAVWSQAFGKPTEPAELVRKGMAAPAPKPPAGTGPGQIILSADDIVR